MERAIAAVIHPYPNDFQKNSFLSWFEYSVLSSWTASNCPRNLTALRKARAPCLCWGTSSSRKKRGSAPLITSLFLQLEYNTPNGGTFESVGETVTAQTEFEKTILPRLLATYEAGRLVPFIG